MSSILTSILLLACAPDSSVEPAVSVQEASLRSAPFTSVAGGFQSLRDPVLLALQPQEDAAGNTPLGGAVVDLDADGWLDVVGLSSTAGPMLWFAGSYGALEVGRDLGVDFEPLGSVASIHSCDLDADGGPELILAGVEGLGIYSMDAAGALEAWEHGIDWVAGDTHLHVACRDLDLDGDLDLWFTGFGEQYGFYEPDGSGGLLPNVSGAYNQLWLGDGEGGFTAAEGALTADRGATMHSLWFWLDGAPVLLESVDHVYSPGSHPDNRPTRLYGWDGEQWVLERELGPQVVAPMGAAMLEWDGRQVLVQSEIGQPSVEAVTSAGGAIQSYAAGAVLGCMADVESDAVSGVNWSVLAVDLAGSGAPQDLLLSTGNLSALEFDLGGIQQSDQRSRLYRGEDCAVSDFDALHGEPSEAESRGMARGDLNNDGIPDVVVFNTNEPPYVLYGEGTEASRLVVELEDLRSNNRQGVGARVSVFLPTGEVIESTLDPSGVGSYSASQPALFMGMGAHEEIEKIEVSWADGGGDCFEGPFPAHARLKLMRL